MLLSLKGLVVAKILLLFLSSIHLEELKPFSLILCCKNMAIRIPQVLELAWHLASD